MTKQDVQQGDTLTIDGDKNSTAIVDQVFDHGVYIITPDRCRIPFTFDELTSRKAEVIWRQNDLSR